MKVIPEIVPANDTDTYAHMRPILPQIKDMLMSKSICAQQQAAVNLGNYASVKGARKWMIDNDVTSQLLKLITSDSTILEEISWAISMILREPNSGTKRLVKALIFLVRSNDMMVASNAAWALSYIVNNSADFIDLVVEEGITPDLVRLISSGELQVTIPALTILADIVRMKFEQTDSILMYGAGPVVVSLLGVGNIEIVKKCVTIISHITSGSIQQIQKIIIAGAISPLIKIISKGDDSLKKEGAWALANLLARGDTNQLTYFVAVERGLKPFSDLLSSTDEKTVSVVLDGMRNLLGRAGLLSSEEKVYVEWQFRFAGGIKLLDSLVTTHPNLGEKCRRLKRDFF